jgi:hypothetical protein
MNLHRVNFIANLLVASAAEPSLQNATQETAMRSTLMRAGGQKKIHFGFQKKR